MVGCCSSPQYVIPLWIYAWIASISYMLLEYRYLLDIRYLLSARYKISARIIFQRRQWHPTPVLLPGESQGRGSLVGCHLWGSMGLHRVGHDWSHLAAVAAELSFSLLCPSTKEAYTIFCSCTHKIEQYSYSMSLRALLKYLPSHFPTSCVTLNKCLKFFLSPFPHFLNKEDISSFSGVFWGLSEIINTKHVSVWNHM